MLWSVNALHLANSVVNPFVYIFRMPIFKDALKKLCHKRRQSVEMRPVDAGTHDLRLEGSFTPKMEHSMRNTLDMPGYETYLN